MQTHKDVIYVFAGSQTSVINNIFLNKENAFFNFATIMNLDMLDKTSTKKFVEELIIDDKKLNTKAIELLYEYTKFHPFYLIKTIQEAYIDALLNQASKIKKEHVENGTKKILSDNNAYFESIWQKINHKKYKGAIFKNYCLDKNNISKLEMNSSYKSQLTKELKLESLLSNDLKSTDPFLCLWLHRI
jgi:hypothetical protein